MRILRDVVEQHRHGALVGDARVVSPERVLGHRRAIVMRRDNEHRIGSTLCRVSRAAHALARGFSAGSGEEPAIGWHEWASELGEPKPLVLVEKRGLARGTGHEHTREPGREMRLDVRAECAAREVAALLLECRDDGAEDARQRFRHGGGQGLFRSRMSPAVESGEPPSKVIVRPVSSSIDSVASSGVIGVKKLRKTVPPHFVHLLSAGGFASKNISLPQVMHTIVSIPFGPSAFAIALLHRRKDAGATLSAAPSSRAPHSLSLWQSYHFAPRPRRARPSRAPGAPPAREPVCALAEAPASCRRAAPTCSRCIPNPRRGTARP